MPPLIVAPEIIPHPFRGNPADPLSERCVMLIGERKKKDFGDKPIISYTGTDGSEDRHGSTLNPNGWELGPYRANPLVQLFHQQLIHAIGKTIDLTKNGERWDFDIEFLVDEWRDYGGPNIPLLTWRIAQRDIMATSVSFIPKEWKDRKAETIPSFFAENVEYTRMELTEISIVNVPSNRNALQKAIAESVISENEADALGLGSYFRLMPALEVRSQKPVEEPEDLYASIPAIDVEDLRKVARGEEPSEKLKASMAALQAWLQERATDTDGDEGDQETGVTERQAMESLAESLWQAIQEALTGFDAAEHDGFRLLCADIISYCIYRIDSLKWWGQNWYGEAPADAPVMLAAPDTAIESRARGIALERVGAVLNKANKGRLEQIKTLADEVLASAGKPEDDEDEEDRSIDLAALYASSPEGERDALVNSILGAQGTGRFPR